MKTNVDQESKVLVTGASGLVGSYLTPLVKNSFRNVHVTLHEQIPNIGNSISIDLSNTNDVVAMLGGTKPDIIVNLAAHTDVDKCESDNKMAFSLNKDLVSAISNYVAKNKRVYLVHVSTDYVFDGNDGSYSEISKTNPVNWYGRTKLYGEEEIIRSLDPSSWCIARTSTPFGIHQKKLSFPLFIINKLRRGESVNVLVDQYTSPTYAMNLAQILLEIIEKRVSGIFHVAGKSRLSRYEQALQLAKYFGLNEALINESSIEQMDWKAKRPKDSSLNVDKVKHTLTTKPQTFDRSVAELSTEIKQIEEGLTDSPR
jgi:dTDP-4-dehydrorhamnose reductase